MHGTFLDEREAVAEVTAKHTNEHKPAEVAAAGREHVSVRSVFYT